MKILRKPINFYDHPTRYYALIILHIIEAITFIIRFILVCIDLSQAQEEPKNIAYPVVIFFLEIISTFPIFFADILYSILRCIKTVLCADDEHPICRHQHVVFHVATLTCIPCNCYRDHPPGVLLTRVVILTIFFMIRFIAFILGASCATSYNPRCVPYAVTSSLSLIPFLLTLLIEWLHFHLLWNFRPHRGDDSIKYWNRSHLRFIPDKLIKEERHTWSETTCEEKRDCKSESLQHIVLYHSIHENIKSLGVLDKKDKKIIACHVTTVEQAMKIAQYGFPVNKHRKLSNEIYFTLTAKAWRKSNRSTNALICARLNLGEMVQVERQEEFNFAFHRYRKPLPHTIQNLITGDIKVFFPSQIENWIIILPTENEDRFKAKYYDGCI